MKQSRFNIWVSDYPRKGEHLLFNARTQALLKINQGLRQELDALNNTRKVIPGTQLQENLSSLRENGIIIEDDMQEAEQLKEFFHQLQYESSRKMACEVTILTTYNCNFRCTYCFEEQVRDDIFLDKPTSDAIVRWLINRAEKEDLKSIFLVFYGGEPLLNIKPIYDISWALQEWAGKKHIGFGFGIITNGSLLTADLVDKFLPVGLKEVRVTLDGDRDAHNQKRPFADGKPSFDLIVDNIKKIIDKVSVGVVGNFDQSNYRSIFSLIDYLEKEKILKRLNRIEFAPLNPRLGPPDNPAAVDMGHCLSFFDGNGLHREVVAIKQELIRRGVVIDTGLAINACALNMKNSGLTIDPKGAIYKCNALVGYPQFSLGTVFDNKFKKREEVFLAMRAWEQCPQDCPYLPMCQGGCRFFSYMEQNDLAKVSCKKAYLDQITPELIKMEYEQLIAKRQEKDETKVTACP